MIVAKMIAATRHQQMLVVGLACLLACCSTRVQGGEVLLNDTIHWLLTGISTSSQQASGKLFNLNFTGADFVMKDRFGKLLNDRASYSYDDTNRAVVSLVDGGAAKRSYEDDRKYMHELLDHFKGLTDRSYATIDLTCNLQPFRAYDTMLLEGRVQHVGALEPIWCSFKMNSTRGKDRSFKRELAEAYDIRQSIMALNFTSKYYYRTTALVAVYGSDPELFTSITFDESFAINYMVQLGQNPSEREAVLEESKRHLRAVIDLSAKEVRKRNSMFPAFQHLESLGLDNYLRHFDYSYIESATYVDGSLCFTSGLRKVRGPHINCWRAILALSNNRDPIQSPFRAAQGGGAGAAAAKNETPTAGGQLVVPPNTGPSAAVGMFEQFENAIDNLGTVVDEIEISYDTEKKMYYYHALAYRYSQDEYTSYWHCQVPAGPASKPVTFLGKDEGCSPLEPIRRSPLGIATYENPSGSCKRLVVFYLHLVQLYALDQKITDAPKATIPIDWMVFPMNAALYIKGRFHLFASGNSVWTMKAKDDADCVDIFDAKTLREFRSSELLWQYRTDYMNASDKATAPVFTGQSSFEQGRLTDDVALRPFRDDYQINVDKFAQMAATKSGGNVGKPGGGGGGDGKPGGMSWLLIAVVAVPLPLLTIGLVYYCCVRKQPAKRANQMQLASGGGSLAPGARPSSDLEQARTIRSSLDALRSKSPSGAPKSKMGAAGGGASKMASSKLGSKLSSKTRSNASKGPKSAKTSTKSRLKASPSHAAKSAKSMRPSRV